MQNNYKQSKRIYSIAVVLFFFGLLAVILGLALPFAMDDYTGGWTLFGAGVALMLLNPFIEGLAIIVRNAELELTKKENEEN